jgi:hypothetical protein
MLVFRVGTKCGLVGRYQCSSALKMEAVCSSETQIHMVLQPRRPTSESSLPWEHKSHIVRVTLVQKCIISYRIFICIACQTFRKYMAAALQCLLLLPYVVSTFVGRLFIGASSCLICPFLHFVYCPPVYNGDNAGNWGAAMLQVNTETHFETGLFNFIVYLKW